MERITYEKFSKQLDDYRRACIQFGMDLGNGGERPNERELFDYVEHLEAKLKHYEDRELQFCESENARLKRELEHEKKRSSQFKRSLDVTHEMNDGLHKELEACKGDVVAEFISEEIGLCSQKNYPIVRINFNEISTSKVNSPLKFHNGIRDKVKHQVIIKQVKGE